MKPGKLITFLIHQKKAGIFIFNTTVLVIASFVAGYNLRLNETKPATTLVVRLTSDHIAGAGKRFALPPAPLETPLRASSVLAAPPAPPAHTETVRQTEKNKEPIMKAEPMARKHPRPALSSQKTPVKREAPAEQETLLSLRIKKERRTITPSTIPYLNLSEYTNALTQQKKRTAVASGDFSLAKTTAPLIFKTDFTNKAFENNRFHGFKSLDLLHFDHNTNAIKEFVRHLIGNRTVTDTDYHFLIFGETLVQIRYLEKEIFKPGHGKRNVRIGVVHKTADTPATLRSLRQELSQSPVSDGPLEIITAENMSFFFH